jgi:hypothetical protein
VDESYLLTARFEQEYDRISVEEIKVPGTGAWHLYQQVENYLPCFARTINTVSG